MDDSTKSFQQSNAFYNFLYKISTARLVTEFDDIQKQVLLGIPKLLNCEACAFVLLENKHKEWMIQKSLGTDTEFVYRINPRDGIGLIKECLRSNTAFFNNQTTQDKSLRSL